jgi:hypothetical protein
MAQFQPHRFDCREVNRKLLQTSRFGHEAAAWHHLGSSLLLPPRTRALQAIIEMCRVINAIFIEDQRVGERADLQQAMPVHRISSQA